MKFYQHYHYIYTNDFFLPLISAENKAHHCGSQALISQSFFSEYSQMTCSFDFSSVYRQLGCVTSHVQCGHSLRWVYF